MANVVANVASLMSGAIVLHMGKLAIGAKALIISKLSVVPRLQPRRDRALTEARSHSRPDVVPWGATMATMLKERSISSSSGDVDRDVLAELLVSGLEAFEDGCGAALR